MGQTDPGFGLSNHKNFLFLPDENKMTQLPSAISLTDEFYELNDHLKFFSMRKDQNSYTRELSVGFGKV